MNRIFNFLLVVPFFVMVSYVLFLYSERPINNRTRNENTVYLRTFDDPKGKWFPIIDSDPTPMRQFWFVRGGFYYVWHESGNVTLIDTPTFQKLKGIN